MQSARSIHPKLFVVLTHVLGLGAVALTVAAFYLLAYLPMKTQQESDEQRSGYLTTVLDTALDTRREHVQLTKKLDELNRRVEHTRNQTPVGSFESQFLAEASRIASESGLEIEDFRRGNTRHLPTHAELEITLAGSGSYEGICRFLSEMEAMPRAKQVRRFEVETADDPGAYPVEIAYTLYFQQKNSDSGDRKGAL